MTDELREKEKKWRGGGRCWCGWRGKEVTYLDRWVQSYPARWSPYPAPAAIAHVSHGYLLALQDGEQEKIRVRDQVYRAQPPRKNKILREWNM